MTIKRFTRQSKVNPIRSNTAKWRLSGCESLHTHHGFVSTWRGKSILPSGSTEMKHAPSLSSTLDSGLIVHLFETNWSFLDSRVLCSRRRLHHPLQAPVASGDRPPWKTTQTTCDLHEVMAFTPLLYMHFVTITGRHHFEYEFKGGLECISKLFMSIIRSFWMSTGVLLYFDSLVEGLGISAIKSLCRKDCIPKANKRPLSDQERRRLIIRFGLHLYKV